MCFYATKSLGLTAVSGGWNANTPTFPEPTLFSSPEN